MASLKEGWAGGAPALALGGSNGARGAAGGSAAGAQEVQPKKRRRVVKRDPSKPSPKAWEESEIALLRQLVVAEGPGEDRIRDSYYEIESLWVYFGAEIGESGAGDWGGKSMRLGSGRCVYMLFFY